MLATREEVGVESDIFKVKFCNTDALFKGKGISSVWCKLLTGGYSWRVFICGGGEGQARHKVFVAAVTL